MPSQPTGILDLDNALLEGVDHRHVAHLIRAFDIMAGQLQGVSGAGSSAHVPALDRTPWPRCGGTAEACTPTTQVGAYTAGHHGFGRDLVQPRHPAYALSDEHGLHRRARGRQAELPS